MEQEIIKYMKDNVDLNPNRYENAMSKYNELKTELLNKGYKRVEIQGSFATKTAIKPVDKDAEYDIDVLVQIQGTVPSGDQPKIRDIRNKLKDDILQIKDKHGWQVQVLEMKKGLVIEFQNDFHIDIVPVFSEVDVEKRNDYIFDYSTNTPKFGKPFELTELLVREIDPNKRFLMKVVKKLVQTECDKVEDLNLLPSIGTAVMVIDGIKRNTNFSIKAVINIIDFMIKTKRGDLLNPVDPNENFFGEVEVDSKSKKYLTAMHSIQLTLQSAVNSKDPKIVTKMIGGCEMEVSSGITDGEGGSGGHA